MSNVERLAPSPVMAGSLIQAISSATPGVKLHLAAFVAVALLTAVYVVGYPLVIALALLGAASALTFLVVLTSLDLFSQANRLARDEAKRHPRRVL